MHSHRPSRHQARHPGQQHQDAYQRTHTAPETPTLLHLPSSTSSAASACLSPRSAPSPSRAASNPSAPALTPTPTPTQLLTSATSSSYFSPQSAATSVKDARPLTVRRPPASFSGNGTDTSRGPPITLITRGNSDIARRTAQSPADLAGAQQQFAQLGPVSPGGASRSSRGRSSNPTQTNTPTLSRHSSVTSPRPQPHMANAVGEYAGTDSGQGEDLFLNIAADSASRGTPADGTTRPDRLRASPRYPHLMTAR
jgi:hypothetical protein